MANAVLTKADSEVFLKLGPPPAVPTDGTDATAWNSLVGDGKMIDTDGTTNVLDGCSRFDPISEEANVITKTVVGEKTARSYAGIATRGQWEFDFILKRSIALHRQLARAKPGAEISVGVYGPKDNLSTPQSNDMAAYIHGEILSKTPDLAPDEDTQEVSIAVAIDETFILFKP